MTLLEQSAADKATIAILTAQVASLPGLQSQIATLTTENTQLKADKATLETNLTAANAATATANAATVAAVEKGKADVTAAVAAANTAKDQELDTKAAAKAAVIVAGATGAPVVTTGVDKPGAKVEKPLIGLAKYQAAIAEDITGSSGK